VPIEALAQATEEISSGHLDYRIQTHAMDELASLVHSFNEMTQQLETKRRELQQSNYDLGMANGELDARRRVIDAILENIGPGVVSTSARGEILKANSSLAKIFPPSLGIAPRHLTELLPREVFEELLHMMNRARRTGLAAREFEIEQAGQIMHLAVTVSALERQDQPESTEPPGFVIVFEDTTELLRAQKSAAWNEVARRVAHEIKNPLTPIALSAERMSRLLKRYSGVPEPGERQKLREHFEKCTRIIVQEVETLRGLVDEFSQFARFPAAQPERADINAVVESALDVFQGRLNGVVIRKRLAPGLPAVFVDPRQFKQALVNLIDNAAEAVHDSWVKEIHIVTAAGPLPETVELSVADSGHGITPEDKQRLFLPYFSTRKRGTGLGLAIVSRILTEHQATIRVEDNRPSGSRFIIEIPTVESVARVPAGARV
jgi:PAS domain S-box-containing protein